MHATGTPILTDDDLDFALSGDASAAFNGFFDDPVKWIQNHFYIPETGVPMQLYPAQSMPLAEALRRDADGLFAYSTVLWSAIKKSAKSSIAAAVGLGFAWGIPHARIKVLGNDLKQAKSRVFEYMERAIRLNPAWRDIVTVNKYEIKFPNGSRIEALPIDPEGEAGGNDDLVIYTELWGWIHGKAQRMWTESTLSPTKYGKSMRWCESYAGFENESVVLEALYKSAVIPEQCIDQTHEMYANPSARLFALWMTKPSLPWQTPAYYAQEAASLTPEENLRVHRNVWATSSNPFVPYAWWETCAGDVPASKRLIVALDAAVSGDCFGMIGVSSFVERTETAIVQKVGIQEVHVIEPPQNGKIDYDEARDVLKAWAQRYTIVAVVYDPYQLHDFASRGIDGHSLNFKEFNQGAERLVADRALYDMIRDVRIVHADNPDLNQHVKNAARKEQGDNKLRIIKKNSKLPIDLTVCASMASHAALDPKYNSRLTIGSAPSALAEYRG